MASTGPVWPSARATMVAPEPEEPTPRSTTPLGTLMVAGTVYVPACSSTTVPDMQPSRVACNVDAWPGVTVAHTVVLTGRPSGPSGWFSSVSARMPGFQTVVM